MEAASKAPVHWVRALTTVLTPPAVVLGFESRYRRRYVLGAGKTTGGRVEGAGPPL